MIANKSLTLKFMFEAGNFLATFWHIRFLLWTAKRKLHYYIPSDNFKILFN